MPRRTTLFADWTKAEDVPGEEDETFYPGKIVFDDPITVTVTFKGGRQAAEYRVTVSGCRHPAEIGKLHRRALTDRAKHRAAPSPREEGRGEGRASSGEVTPSPAEGG